MVGGRGAGYARRFLDDVAGRLVNRVQLTTDGHGSYLNTVPEAFAWDVDWAMLVKIYGRETKEAERRYSPAPCLGAKKQPQNRKSRSEAHLHQLCGAPEPNDADGDAPVYAPDECLLKEGRAPYCVAGDSLHVLQLRAHPPDHPVDAGDGSGDHRTSLGGRGHRCPTG